MAASRFPSKVSDKCSEAHCMFRFQRDGHVINSARDSLPDLELLNL
jgi:hypothetical protein